MTSSSIPPAPTPLITTVTLPTRAPAASCARTTWRLTTCAFDLADFGRFDRILVADRRNYQDVTALASDDAQRSKVGFMLETLPDSPALPDPYLGQAEDFERTFTLLEQALRLRFAHES